MKSGGMSDTTIGTKDVVKSQQAKVTAEIIADKLELELVLIKKFGLYVIQENNAIRKFTR